jgi:ATP-dependent DNA helicase DinG
MICDPRLITKPYGRRIWQSLPSFKRTRVQEDVLRFFDPAAEADDSDAGTGA